MTLIVHWKSVSGEPVEGPFLGSQVTATGRIIIVTAHPDTARPIHLSGSSITVEERCEANLYHLLESILENTRAY